MEATDDFTLIEQELVAQARLITDAKYEMREQDFYESIRHIVPIWSERWGSHA
jgi:hypothetical protein